jgi:hypothetical protein
LCSSCFLSGGVESHPSGDDIGSQFGQPLPIGERLARSRTKASSTSTPSCAEIIPVAWCTLGAVQRPAAGRRIALPADGPGLFLQPPSQGQFGERQ